MKRFLPVILIVTFIFCLFNNNLQAQNGNNPPGQINGSQFNQVVSNGISTTEVDFAGAGCIYNWVNDMPGIGLPASGTTIVPSFAAVNNANVPVVATITLTPVSPTYAYIANYGSNNVSVINVATGAVIKTIPIGTGPYGVTVSPDGRYVYVAISGVNNIAIINTLTNTSSPGFNAQGVPAEMAISADGSTLYVTNSVSNNVSIVNVNTLFGAIVPVGNDPLGIAISPDGSKVYVVNSGDNNISVINTLTRVVDATIHVGTQPRGIAVSPDGSKIYVSNYVDGTVSVINAVNYNLETTIHTGSGSNGISISPDGSRLYVTNSNSNNVSVIITSTNAEVALIPVGNGPLGVSVSPDGSKVYVANENDGTVSVINTANNTVVPATIAVGSLPFSYGNFMAASPSNCPPFRFTITVNPFFNPAIIFYTGSLMGLTTVQGAASASTNFSVAGGDLTGSILVTPPTGFEVSTDNINFSNTVTAAGSGAATTVYVRLAAATPAGTYSGNVVLSSNGAANVNVATASSVVTAAATPSIITATSTLLALGTIYGIPSNSTMFNIAATGTNTPVLVTPPDGFEVSTDDINFSKTLTAIIPNATSSVPIYVRLAATTPAGLYSHDIVLSSVGSADVFVPTSGSIVYPAALTITADNKTKAFGQDNPVLTVGYSGFVNNDTPDSLAAQPLATTTAVTTSPAGQYPITVSSAGSSNYNITYVAGILTVSPALPILVVPNAFTPNNDGVNDFWNIKNIDNYPNCTVQIYNRYGEQVYSSIGYGISWDGKYKGTYLPTDAYYYIINPQNGSKILSGSVTIIR